MNIEQIEQKGGQSFQPKQTGLSRLESFVMQAAESRWARGACAVLGLGAGGAVADYLIQPAFAQVEYSKTPVSELSGTPVPEGTPPVILTAEAQRDAAGIRNAQIQKQNAEEATMAKAQQTATAVVAQAREEYPEWAAEEDRLQKIDQIVPAIGLIGFGALVVYVIYQESLKRR